MNKPENKADDTSALLYLDGNACLTGDCAHATGGECIYALIALAKRDAPVARAQVAALREAMNRIWAAYNTTCEMCLHHHGIAAEALGKEGAP